MSEDRQEVLLYEVRDEIAHITLNRPQRLNAVNGALATALKSAWERFEADPGARVAILSGAGKAFSAGRDISEGAELLKKIPPIYIRSVKYGHYRSVETDAHRREREYIDYVWPQEMSADVEEARAAFRERRDPNFTRS